MASSVTLDDLLHKQQEMNDLAVSLAGETSVDRIQQVAEDLRVRGEELERMARALEAEQAAAAAPLGYAEVVLTDAQRERIRTATTIDLASIRIPDEAGITTTTMPLTQPVTIEVMAMRQAEQMRAAREGDIQLRAALDESFATIEAQSSEALHEQLAKMKSDPKFFGGILKKE